MSKPSTATIEKARTKNWCRAEIVEATIAAASGWSLQPSELKLEVVYGLMPEGGRKAVEVFVGEFDLYGRLPFAKVFSALTNR